MFTIATWNVNGIRARETQLQEWIERERPDVICLQEIKASSAQVPAALCEMEGYWCYWHGEKGYSGVGLHIRKESCAERPVFSHPPFDYENRIVTTQIGGLTVGSVYVPNGGKDFDAKMRFLDALEHFVAAFEATGAPVVLCGDLNIARTDRDVHPKERKPGIIGQRPDERALLERIISHGLVDVGRALDPDNDNLFTWWAPWRNLRQRNIGWRLDYVLASESLARGAIECPVQRGVGTSDHGPVMARFSGQTLELWGVIRHATSVDPRTPNPRTPNPEPRTPSLFE
ncbi:MAG: exodeoxyribonuclease III [Acidobacteria bacterium]|nr:exodeoxyribonuclease III [Acidobacteriota bacterium]